MLNFNMKQQNEKIILEDEFFADRALSCSLILFDDFVLIDDVDVFDFSKLCDASCPLLIFDNIG